MEKKREKRNSKRKEKKMKCSGCDSGKEGKCTGYQRRWDFYEWVDAFKGPRVNSLSKMIYWTKIHLFCVTPQKLFFFSLHQSSNGVYGGWTERGTNTPLPQQPRFDGKARRVGNVAAESVERVARATPATQGDYLGVGKLLLDTDNLTHFLVVPLLSALLFDCLLPRATEKENKVQVPVSLNSSAWSSGNSLWGRFRFGAFDIGAVSGLLLVCVIKRRKMGKMCLDWEGSDPDRCTHLFGWIKPNRSNAWSAASPLKNNDTRKADKNLASGLGNETFGVRANWKSPSVRANSTIRPKYSHLRQR